MSVLAGLRQLTGGGVPSQQNRRRIARRMMQKVRGYPEQRAMVQQALRDGPPLTCIQANRRAGKTEGVGTALVAQLVAEDGYTIVQLTQHLPLPTQQWWDRKGTTSALDLLRENGLLEHATIRRAMGHIKSITFPWGSALNIIVIANESDIQKIRGLTAHVFWIDEAQDVSLLGAALPSGVLPQLADFGGRVILSGTPGHDRESYFGRVAQGVIEDYGQASVWSWQNPAFGATAEERWHTIVDRAIKPGRERYRLSPDALGRIRAMTPADIQQLRSARVSRGAEKQRGTAQTSPLANKPQHLTAPQELSEFAHSLDDVLLREQFGLWAGDSARQVFQWSRLTSGNRYWCRASAMYGAELPLATTLAERAKLLPTIPYAAGAAPHKWVASIGVDIGYKPDPAAVVVWLRADTCPHLYELWSEIHYEREDSWLLARVGQLIEEIEELGSIEISRIVADMGGDRAGTRKEWGLQLARRVRRELPIVLPLKHDKPAQIRALNLDLENDLLQVVEGSPLDIEGRYLRYRPADADIDTYTPKIWKRREVVLPNGKHVRPGDHCLDGTRYCLPDFHAGKAPTHDPTDLSVDAWLKHRADEDERQRRKRGRRRR